MNCYAPQASCMTLRDVPDSSVPPSGIIAPLFSTSVGSLHSCHTMKVLLECLPLCWSSNLAMITT